MTRVAALSVRSAAAAHVEVDVSVPGWPIGPPRAWVEQMARSLDFYLALGCEVRCAADGWALLHSGPTVFVLIQITTTTRTRPRSTGPPIPAPGWVRLTTPDIRALRRRLLNEGIPAAPVISPCNIPEIEITDPDLHRVVIAELKVGPTPPAGPADCVRTASRSRSRSGHGHLVSITTPPARR